MDGPNIRLGESSPPSSQSLTHVPVYGVTQDPVGTMLTLFARGEKVGVRGPLITIQRHTMRIGWHLDLSALFVLLGGFLCGLVLLPLGWLGW